MIIDQRIAVFGGASGIGLAVAQACADAGAELLRTYLYALRNPYVTGQTLVVDGGVSLL